MSICNLCNWCCCNLFDTEYDEIQLIECNALYIKSTWELIQFLNNHCIFYDYTIHRETQEPYLYICKYDIPNRNFIEKQLEIFTGLTHIYNSKRDIQTIFTYEIK